MRQGGFFDDSVAHILKAEGFDASEDGTGRGTPLTVTCIKGAAIGRKPQNGPQRGETLEDLSYTLNCIDRHAVAFSCKDHGGDAGEVSPTLRSMGHQGSHPNGGGQVAVAFETRFARNGRGAPSDVVPPLKASSGQTGKGDGAPCVAFDWNAQTDQMNFSTTTPSLTCSQQAAIGPVHMSVRRLTPRECERLQGFPDHYTDIPYRGKAAPDGPRYKALGNSMAVPCMRWIGQRIAKANRSARDLI
jgi:DNA (cytosine-5)-methyltransferase 1